MSEGESGEVTGIIKYRVNSVTASEVSMTITDVPTGSTQNIRLTQNVPVTVFGHRFELTAIKDVNVVVAGTGQPLYMKKATVDLVI
jgi:ABC-type tungstate transport system permease subunit